MVFRGGEVIIGLVLDIFVVLLVSWVGGTVWRCFWVCVYSCICVGLGWGVRSRGGWYGWVGVLIDFFD